MGTYKIFKAGNSKVVTIADDLADKYGLALGTRVVLQDTNKGILIKPVKGQASLPSDLSGWLLKFEKKHYRALAELAKR